MYQSDSHQFQKIVYDFYDRHGRHELPWRQLGADGQLDPYHVLVSELMLQQTQVGRVIPKFQAFITTFPTIADLAAAPLSAVLTLWSGLGYNRRAKFLWQAATRLQEQYQGTLPADIHELASLPGVGPNTAGAIAAYAFNQPVSFIETNIRTVYIHHFFAEKAQVSDREIMPYLANSLDQEHPRQFYWALMDYGSYLKQTVGNLSRRSSSYSRQAPFAGSLRQVRGAVIKQLTQGSRTHLELAAQLSDARLAVVLEALLSEGLIDKQGGRYQLAEAKA